MLVGAGWFKGAGWDGAICGSFVEALVRLEMHSHLDDSPIFFFLLDIIPTLSKSREQSLNPETNQLRISDILISPNRLVQTKRK